MRAASAHSIRASQNSPHLSVHDVYRLAERTHTCTSLEARLWVLTQTQLAVQRGPVFSGGPDAGTTTPGQGDSLTEDNSTSTSCHVTEDGPGPGDQDTDKDEAVASPLGFVRDVQVTLKPQNTSVSKNCRSFFDARNHDVQHRVFSKAETPPTDFLRACTSKTGGKDARSLTSSCQCTDIASPSVCRDCRKRCTESETSQRMLASFPPLNLDENHVTSSILVRRARPDMKSTEIRDKLKTGEVSSSTVSPIFRRCCTFEKDNVVKKGEQLDDIHAHSDRQEGNRRNEIRGRNYIDNLPKQKTYTNPTTFQSGFNLKFTGGETTTPLYFMDLRHLSAKAFHGTAGRSLTVSGEKKKKKTECSDYQSLWPAFVSPRKCKLMEEPKYKAYFGPPLLTKRKQIPNPAFFAGSDDPYSLPERLPDEVFG